MFYERGASYTRVRKNRKKIVGKKRKKRLVGSNHKGLENNKKNCKVVSGHFSNEKPPNKFSEVAENFTAVLLAP